MNLSINPADIIVLTIVIGLIALCVYSLYRDKKAGISTCGGCCHNCSGCCLACQHKHRKIIKN